MDEELGAAVALFNQQKFTEFQDALEAIAATTRAPSERQFYASLTLLAEALHQLGNDELGAADATLGLVLRRLEEFLPRFRGLNVEALREDARRTLLEIREVREGRKPEFDPRRLPRLRVLPA
jgi:hypothetical protein